MSAREFFQNQKGIVTSKDLDRLGTADAESADQIKQRQVQKDTVVPNINWATASNFAMYGSAEKYYMDAMSVIANQWPYDGSEAEQQKFLNDAGNVTKWVLEEKYPRTNGYAILGRNFGDLQSYETNDLGGYGAPATASYEYIRITGGPHTASGGMPTGSLATTFTGSNYYDTDIYSTNKALQSDRLGSRLSNLRTNLDNGVTVEFWLKKPAWDLTKTQKEVIFDLWNGAAKTAGNYGRFRVELTGGASGSPFRVTILSGSHAGSLGGGVHNVPIGDSTVTTGFMEDWNHYAITVANSGSKQQIRLFVNGNLNHTVGTGSATLGEITGSLTANIGALRTAPSGAYTDPTQGWGKLSASMDEFRFWKEARSHKEIGRSWFTQVRGGSNTDIANASLGVYYKFNEGITGNSTTDSTVLDYSGRISNGVWVGYPDSASRNTGSAILEASAADKEFEDPIIYTGHSLVSGLSSSLAISGSDWDSQNNSSLLMSIPHWISEEDDTSGDGTFKNMVQLVGSYFDNLHLMIGQLPKVKAPGYMSSSHKPYPFASNLISNLGISTPELFIEADVLNIMMQRDEDRNFKEDVDDVKNLIYQNIYNNLSYIFKTKGTTKSIRNLLHCFGVDEDIVRLNLYANNADHNLRDSYRETVVKKRYVNFNDPDKFSSTVYQYADPSNSNTVGFISGSLTGSLERAESHLGFTAECEAIFPIKPDIRNSFYFDTPFQSASIFGMHTAKGETAASTGWRDPDDANFQVYLIKPNRESADGYFSLTSTTPSPISELTTSLFKGVYDNEKWNLSVSVRPENYGITNLVTGSSANAYKLEFFGTNVRGGVVERSFHKTQMIGTASAEKFMRAHKRMYVGCHRTDFTGSALQKSDAKISGVRYWASYLPTSSIIAHAKDPRNYGVEHPYRSPYLGQKTIAGPNTGSFIPHIDTLALHWDFGNVISASSDSGDPSSADSIFYVDDISSGSSDLTSRAGAGWGYSWLGNIAKKQHSGKGDFFLPPESGDGNAIDFNFVGASRLQPPENIDSNDMIQITTEADEAKDFSAEDRITDYFYSIEKSMYRTMSEEMMNFFGSIVGFNNLIGEPVNRYRPQYKDIEKLKQLFFDRIGNTPQLDKYVDYYKWIDSSIAEFIRQLVPASANISEDVRTMVESHVLERNKYWSKFPTIEFKAEDPEASLFGISEMLYDWEHGHAPLPDTAATATFVGTTALAGEDGTNLILTNADGSTVTFHTDPTKNFGDTSNDDGDHRWIINTGGDFSSEGIRKATQAFHIACLTAIAAGELDMTAVPATNTGTQTSFTLTQTTLGEDGNTAITLVTGMTANGETAFTGGSTPEEKNALWWRERAAREHSRLTSATPELDRDRNVIRDRITTHVSASGIGSVTTKGGTAFKTKKYPRRVFTRTYNFETNNLRHIGGGINFNKNKKLGFIRSRILKNAMGASVLAVSASEVYNFPNIDDVQNPSAKRMYTFKAFTDANQNNDFTNSGKGHLIAPFNLVSSSVSTGYQTDVVLWSPPLSGSASVQITNLHTDAYGPDKEIPMQGPFPEKYVGGYFNRHVDLNYADSNKSLDERHNRPEAWDLSFSNTTNAQSAIVFSRPAGHTPSALWSRDFGRKCHYNIKNIKQITGSTATGSTTTSPTKIGNYTFNYDVVQIAGRSSNNRFLKRSYSNDDTIGKSNVAPLPGLIHSGASALPATTNVHTLIAVRPEDANDHGPSFITSPTTADDSPSLDRDTSLRFAQQNSGSTAATATFVGTAALNGADGTNIILTNADGSTVTFHTDPTKNFGDTSSDGGDHIWEVNTGGISGGSEVRKATQAFHIACLAAIAALELDMTAVPATNTGTQTSFTLTQTTAGTAGNTAITLVTGMTANGETTFTGGTAATSATVFTLPRRDLTGSDSVIVSRFSSPGGPEQMSRGFLDKNAEEYSVYNALPFRNLSVLGSGSGEANTMRVRDHLNTTYGLRTHLARYSGQFGHDQQIGSVSSTTYVTNPSLHKTNRNRLKRMELSGTPTYVAHNATTFDGIAMDAAGGVSTRVRDDRVEIEDEGGLTALNYFDDIFGSDGTDKCTIAAWIRWDGIGDHSDLTAGERGWQSIFCAGFMNKNTFKAGRGLMFGISGSEADNAKLFFHRAYAGGSADDRSLVVKTSDKCINPGVWTLVAVTFDGTSNALGPVAAGEGGVNQNDGYQDAQGALPTFYVWERDSDYAKYASGSIEYATSRGGFIGDPRFGDASDSAPVTFASPNELAPMIGNGAGTATSGSNYDTCTFSGAIAECMIWDGILNDPEVWSINRNYDDYLSWGPQALTESHAAENANLCAWYKLGGGDTAAVSDVSTGSATGRIFDATASAGTVGDSTSLVSHYPTYVTSSKYDNGYISHMIPRSDMQYSWITASLASSGSRVLGYAPYSGRVSSSAVRTRDGVLVRQGWENALNFVSASELVSVVKDGERRFAKDKSNVGSGQTGLMFTDFVGLNTNIREPITSSLAASTNNLGFAISKDATYYINIGSPGELADAGSEDFVTGGFINSAVKPALNTLESGSPGSVGALNCLLLHRNGPYGYPSWKQIRTGEHPVARYQRKNNIYSIVRAGEVANFDSAAPTVASEFGTIDVFERITPVSSKYRPVEHAVTLYTEGLTYDEASNNYTFFYDPANEPPLKVIVGTTHGNDLVYFDDSKVDASASVSLVVRSVTAYDLVKDQYANGALLGLESSVENLTSISYKEIIYPSSENMYDNRVRQRYNYTNNFWRKNRADRHITAPPTTTGQALKHSMWPLDAFDTFASGTEVSVTASGVTAISGELMNTHTYFHNIGASLAGASGSIGQPSSIVIDYSAISAVANASPCYIRPHLLSSTASVTNPNRPVAAGRLANSDGHTDRNWAGSASIGYGYAEWQVAESAGRYDLSAGQVGRAAWVSGSSDPWYKDYDSYATEIRAQAKDYSIIPEFRIGDNIGFYVVTNQGNVLADQQNMFEIIGQDNSSDTYPQSSVTASFYEIYSTSDFMKNFATIKSDLEGVAEPAKLTLTCRAAIKFLPYDGFYPCERTLALAKQFSSSYASSVSFEGGIAATNEDGFDAANAPTKGSWRAFLQPMMAPGILFNSIKSGLAVDYPIMTHGSKIRKTKLGNSDYWGLGFDGVGESPLFDEDGRNGNNKTDPDNITNQSFNLGTFYDERLLIKTNADIGNTASLDYNAGVWDYRIPFEAILNPEKYILNTPLIDHEPDPRVRIDVTASWDGGGNFLYKMMANNFCAEVSNFFLNDGQNTKITSRGEDAMNLAIQGGDIYGARVKLRRSMNKARSWDEDVTEGGGSNTAIKDTFAATGSYELPQDPRNQTGMVETFTMYSRPSAFGPPVWGRIHQKIHMNTYNTGSNNFHRESMSGSDWGTMDSLEGYYWSFTPPYYDGEAWADILFAPSSTKEYTLDELMSEVKIQYWRHDPGIHDPNAGNFAAVKTLADERYPKFTTNGMHSSSLYSGENINRNAMQISASLNLLSQEITDTFQVTVNKATGKTEISNLADQKVWTIQPKFETPMFNFNPSYNPAQRASDLTIPTHGSESVPSGMWHQYGAIENSAHRGIFMEINDIPQNWLQNHGWPRTTDIYQSSLSSTLTGADLEYQRMQDAANMKSLVDLVGFDSTPTKLGQIRDTLTVEEAIVAVPFIEKSGEKSFFALEPNQVAQALGRPLAVEFEPAGPSIMEQINMMGRFILPPTFDFVTNEDVPPIAMYIFPFSYTFDQDDLAHIWQNVAPPCSKKLSLAEASISHDLLLNELMGYANEEEAKFADIGAQKAFAGQFGDITMVNAPFQDKVQWMVFKAKQKGKINYYETIAGGESTQDTTLTDAWESAAGAQKSLPFGTNTNPNYGYNWPYDYFSIIESAQIESEIGFTPLFSVVQALENNAGKVGGKEEADLNDGSGSKRDQHKAGGQDFGKAGVGGDDDDGGGGGGGGAWDGPPGKAPDPNNPGFLLDGSDDPDYEAQ